MPFTIRPFAGDFAGVVALLNTVNDEPMTAEQLEAIHGRFPATGLRHRMVAVDETGCIVGYANTSRTTNTPAGEFWFTLVTAPGARRQGVATALLAELEGWVRTQGGTRVVTGIPDDDRIALTFGQGRGFHVESIQLESSLDIPAFSEAPFAGVVEQVERSGIRFLTFADQPDEAKLYELYKVTDLDSPGYLGLDPVLYPPFNQWHEEMFGDGRTLPEGIFIAANGERWVGCTILQKAGDQGGLYNEYTGVLREYRGRQIALALKLLATRFAKAYGAPYMTTKNNSKNGPMLAVNRKLGYVKVSGRAWLMREL